MGYWGWRPLIICLFISVWVVGCNIITDASPSVSPTPSPRVTLTVRRPMTPTPTATPAFIVALVSPTAVLEESSSGELALTANTAQMFPSPTYTLPSLVLAPPTCYETPAESLICLGRLDNTLDYPLERVVVRVQLVRADGTPLASGEADIEQAVILAGASAPYRALFNSNLSPVSGVIASLQRADPARAVSARFVTLTVQEDEGAWVDGRYVVSATLFNSSPYDAEKPRIIVMLEDDAGRVVGYRVVQAAARLTAGGLLPVHIELVPQAGARVSAYRLYAEARRAAD